MADQGNNETPLPVQATQPAANSDRIPITTLPAPRSQAPNKPEYARIADSLEDEYQIGFQRINPRLHRRYVILRSQELHDRLCNLYAPYFQAGYRVFKHVIEAYPLPAGYASQIAYATACYVSSWCWDLYVSIRESVKKLSQTAFLQQYQTEQFHSQDRYDPFLQHLNTVIRPTHIPGGLEDSLYIPLIANHVQWGNQSPFGINHYAINESLVQGLLDVMDLKNNTWRTVPLSHDTLGRPMWLLDWRQNQAYAWFPQENHFSKEDLIAAHILGIPCSPRLGPRDVDDWQFFPGNVMPQHINIAAYERAIPRRFFGAAEYRTISTRMWELPFLSAVAGQMSGAKRPAPESSATGSGYMESPPAVEGQQTAAIMDPGIMQTRYCQYQIIDWCYHGRVILNLNAQKQNQALRSILFSPN
ncbi:coat protein [Persimmon cryptic virus]|uniref:coat protein n=1 Tax=Persimmon cryptic virus TaxID=1183241 RepID=UPI0002633490|nr:coat protein [Persimmon cryptic virus]CCH50610.1 coat protein [Persimmon cryptic virus]